MIYKYISQDRIDILYQNKIRFTQLSSLNDPYELVQLSVNGKNFLKDVVDRDIGVASFTKSYQNLLMWAHYSEEYTGFVLGFDNNSVFFNSIDNIGNKTEPKNIVYTTKRSNVNIKDKNFTTKILSQKPIEWAYKEEIRIFRSYLLPHDVRIFDENKNEIILFDLPKDIIKEVYFGIRCSVQNKKEVINFIQTKQKNIKIYETYLDWPIQV